MTNLRPITVYQQITGGYQAVPDETFLGYPGTYPSYPDMLTGWQLQANQIDTTFDQGWTQTAGIRTIDQTINRSANTTFGQGPDNDAMVVTVTWDGTNYYSSDAQARFVSLPAVHVVEYYAKLGPLGSGSFPSVWERPLTSGDGEIDHWEWKAKWWNQSPTSPNRFAMNCITTTDGSYANKEQHPKNVLIDANKINLAHWNHYRIRVTATDVTQWINGTQVCIITRDGTGGTITTSEWDRCFGGTHDWYLRVTYQFGSGTTSDIGGTPDPTICPTQLWIRNINIWEPTS